MAVTKESRIKSQLWPVRIFLDSVPQLKDSIQETGNKYISILLLFFSFLIIACSHIQAKNKNLFGYSNVLRQRLQES